MMNEIRELAPGASVTPSIRLQRLLGQGGMGSVWIADHLRLHTQVVVKFMAAEHALNAEALARFEREAALAAQAKSPHVVQVFDHGVSLFGLPYIAMELLDGEDLAHRVARGPIEPVLFANWFGQACRGVGRAHAKGIVHRDLKPENIFLCDNDGEVLVKVLDFGIAKSDETAGFGGTQTGALLGTAYYMSPEQTMGQKDLDHRSDLWALGVVAFYALTGTRPFDGEAIGALVMAINTRAVPNPSSRRPSLGPSVDAWMAKALARPREERFQTAKHMAEAFQSAVAALVPSTHISSSAPPLSPTLLEGGALAGRELALPHSPAPALSGSTMAPSVRGGESDPVMPNKRDRLPVALSAVAVVALFGVGAGWSLTRGKDTTAAALSASPTSISSATAPAASQAPSALPSIAAAEPPSIATAPNASPPATPKVAASAPNALSPAALARPTVVKRAPVAAAPVAAPATAAPTPLVSKPPPPKATPTSGNPLHMKLE